MISANIQDVNIFNPIQSHPITSNQIKSYSTKIYENEMVFTGLIAYCISGSIHVTLESHGCMTSYLIIANPEAKNKCSKPVLSKEDRKYWEFGLSHSRKSSNPVGSFGSFILVFLGRRSWFHSLNICKAMLGQCMTRRSGIGFLVKCLIIL
jgi:hypothetical protein